MTEATVILSKISVVARRERCKVSLCDDLYVPGGLRIICAASLAVNTAGSTCYRR
jgi:hypothetical protein